MIERRKSPKHREARTMAQPWWRDPPRRLALAGAITIVGIGMVGVGESSVGAIAVLVGLLFFAYAIHTYGRLGVERHDA